MDSASHLDFGARSEETRSKQLAIYDQAGAAIWRHSVYDVLHQGWDLACIGGLPFLDAMIERSRLAVGSRVLELGCGSGAACHYLAASSGCWATGVELNSRQLERARSRRTSGNGRLEFLEGDLAQLSMDGSFDAVFELDTFALLPELTTPLAAARRMLAPTGKFYMADLLAGPECNDAVCEYAWETDGFCSLLSPQEMMEVLQASGFSQVEYMDKTGQAAQANAAMLRWLDDPPQPLPAGITERSLVEWRESVRWYHRSFSDGSLGYGWWRAIPGA